LPPSLRDLYSPMNNEGNRVYAEVRKAVQRSEAARWILGYILAWYALSTMNNVVEKQVLSLANVPLGLGMCQMLGTMMISYVCLVLGPAQEGKHGPGRDRAAVLDPEVGGWDSNSVSRSPARVRSSVQMLWRIAPIAGCVAGMRGLHNIALGVVSLKLLQTVKCTAPVLNVLMQKVLHGKSFPAQTYLALLVISVGIVLTCGTEVELSLLGVLMGVLSTFMTNLQTIFGKTLLDDTLENRIGEMELQFWTCLMSAAIYTPLWCITEGLSPVTEAPGETYMLLLAAGVLYFAQSWVALKVLAKLDCALTHTIASTFKRVVLIVFSAMWFGNRVSPLNALGILFAMGGLAYYNFTKHTGAGKAGHTGAGKAAFQSRLFARKDVLPTSV